MREFFIAKPDIRSYRSQGMSNREIAEKLGCSPSTVTRILGPMTREERCAINQLTWDKRKKASPKPASPAQPKATAPVASTAPVAKSISHLSVSSLLMQLKGKHFNYLVDTEEKKVTLARQGSPDIILTLSDVDDFIQELSELKLAANIK